MITHPFRSILGPIPDHWDVVPLRAVLARSASGDWGDERGEMSVQVLRSTNFTADRTLDFTDVARRWFSAERASRFDVRAGDFLLERSGGGPSQPVGRLVRVAADLDGFWYSNFVQLLRIHDGEMVPDFVGWCLFELHRSGTIERLQHQTTQMRNLDFRDYLEMRLPRPPLDAQARIAARISAADAAVRRLSRAVQAVGQLRTTLIGHLLTRGAPDRHDEWLPTKVGVTPAVWEIVPLVAIADIEGGVALNTDRAPRLRPHRYLTVVNVQRGTISENEPRYLELWESEIPRRLLEPGDILVVEGHADSSEIGRAALVKEHESGFAYQNHLFRVRVSDASVDPRFVVHALNSEYARRHWAAVSNTSSGLSTINCRQLRRLLIPKPTLEEQRAILRFIDASERALLEVTRQRASAAAVFHALLRRTLTGSTGRMPIPEVIPA